MPSNDAKILALRERIDYESFFSEFVTLRGRGVERMAQCVFHDDTHPSLGINVQEGVYRCHNPSCAAHDGGDFITFYMRVRSLSFTEALNELCRREGLDYDSIPERPRVENPTEEHERLLAEYRPPAPQPDPEIDEAIIHTMHERLLATPAWMEWLAEHRGITQTTVEEFQIGHDGQRYYIPIRNVAGQCVNIRRYLPNAARAQDKMISWRPGFGSARLFPINRVEEGRVFIFEGEMDCLLARQLGLNALTATGGAGTWRGHEWNEYFRDREVIVCYDADPAGDAGSSMVASQLNEVAAFVKVVHIPLAEPPGADFTDFIVGHGHSIYDFLRLVENTRPFTQEDADGIPAPDPEISTVHLSQASRAEYYNKPVRFPVMVSGKTTSPYLVPMEVRLHCPAAIRGTLPFCDRCSVMEHGGPFNTELPFEGNEILQFTDTPETTLQKAVKKMGGVPVKCPVAGYDVLEALNIEKVQLIPEIERTDEEAPYVTREAFYIGHGLQANRSYIMTGETVPEPKKQLATHVIHTAIQSQSNIDAFRLTSDTITMLKAFSPRERGVEALKRHLTGIYDDLEKHTRIYQRRDLMLATDLVMHSLLSFRFQGERLTRGWCDALIIGDSRTGKTTIVQRMTDWYGAGEMTTGENTTLAGLVGGLHQIGTTWVLQWGRVPLNDRRALIVDEAGNLPIEHIARMSSMRSSGIAEVIKIHTERTNARTRQIWISNPRQPRPLSSFTQGVMAVKDLIGAPEDIARFDLVVTAASGDVPLAIVNAEREYESPEYFNRTLCHQRVMWAWSRGSDCVRWLEDSEQRVLAIATRHGERYRYATDVPLVEPNEQRIKLARLSVSMAALFFSTSEDGQFVHVLPEHVDFAASFLEQLYSKPSLSFTEYADHMRARYTISDDRRVSEIISRHPGALSALMEQDMLSQRDLQEIFSFNDRDELRSAITTLRDTGFLRRQGSSMYVKTPAAIDWLRRRAVGVNGNGQFNLAHNMLEQEMPESPPF